MDSSSTREKKEKKIIMTTTTTTTKQNKNKRKKRIDQNRTCKLCLHSTSMTGKQIIAATPTPTTLKCLKGTRIQTSTRWRMFPANLSYDRCRYEDAEKARVRIGIIFFRRHRQGKEQQGRQRIENGQICCRADVLLQVMITRLLKGAQFVDDRRPRCCTHPVRPPTTFGQNT